MPGTSTTSSSTKASTSSTIECFSQTSVGTSIATPADSRPRNTNSSCRSKYANGLPLSWSDTLIDAEATMTRPTSSSAATMQMTQPSNA